MAGAIMYWPTYEKNRNLVRTQRTMVSTSVPRSLLTTNFKNLAFIG
jgi:hypothetical protein